MERRSTLPLRARAVADAGQTGAKAAGLNRLMVEGFPVPRGFVVLPGGGWGGGVRATRGLDPAFRRDLKRLARNKGLFAVRPSVPDSGEAFLGLAGEETVARAVAKCMAAGQASPGDRDRHRPIIVQRLVDAMASGQVFSCHPETGDPTEIVITGGWGIGREAWVEGKADRFRLRKYPLLICEREVASKDHEYRAGPVGIVRRPLQHAMRLAPCLTDAQATRLGRLVRAVEARIGWPVQLEWAMAADGFFFLQLDRAPVPAEDYFYLTPPVLGGYYESLRGLDLSEVPAGPISPWAVDFFDRAARSILRPLLARAGLSRVAQTPPLVPVAGRLYLNHSNLAASVEEALGLARFSLAAPPGVPRAGVLARVWSRCRLAMHLGIRLPALLVYLGRWDDRRLQAECELIQEECARLERVCREGLRPIGLASALEGIDDLILERLGGAVIASARVAGRLGRFLRRLGRWCGPDHDARTVSLFAGLGGLENAEAGYELWRLAAKIGQDPNWSNDPGAYLAGLAGSPAGREIAAMMEAFAAAHGHHCRGEYDLAIPRWEEDPAAILTECIPLLSLPARDNPAEAALRQASQRSLALAWIEGRLSGGWRRLLFWRLRAFRAEYTRLMEVYPRLARVRSELARLLRQYRRFLLLAGRELAERNCLARVEDVFLLRLAEITAALRDEEAEGRPAFLERRAESRTAYASLSPPARLSGCYREGIFPENREADAPLRGLGASPGTASGPARVIESAAEIAHVTRRDVLVAKNLDAGWAAQILAAGAIVTEFGGFLSEQAVLAREYGLPAVVRAAGVTSRIRTGDLIQIDGRNGLIKVVEVSGVAQAAVAGEG